MKQKLYSIGRFAKICDVSVKQLRYLEEKGLLIPKIRNTDNNYRYYSHSQLDLLVFIKTLRDIGVPFEDIVVMMQQKDLDVSVGVLQNHLDSIDQQIKQLLGTYRQTSSYLTQMLKSQCVIAGIEQHGGKGCDNFHIVDMLPQTILCHRYPTNVAAHTLFLERFFDLKKESLARNIPTQEKLHAIFHDGYMKQFENKQGDLETFFTVQHPADDAQNLRRFGGFKALSSIFVGHYKYMQQHYLKMERWAQDNGIQLMDLSIESYTMGPDISITPEHYITEIIIPLQGSTV